VDINSAGGRRDGLSAEQIEALTSMQDAGTLSVFDEKERLIVELADALAATPANVSDELFARLHANFTEEELIELAADCAHENYRARWNRLFDVGSDGFYRVKHTHSEVGQR
jgi:alkylhydroperoxidase family enzyme